MTERSSFEAPGDVPAPSDMWSPPQATAAQPAPSLLKPTLAAPPPRGPIVASPSHHLRVGTALPADPAPTWNEPARRWPMRLLVWSIVIVALVGAAGYLTGFWDPTPETSSPAAVDRSDATQDSTTPTEPAVGPSDALAGVCGELQQVQVLSNEVSLILNAALQELTASPGEMDEAAVQESLREAADLMDRSLPDLLSVYESAAQLAPADVAADLRVVADGTALLTPTIVDVMRNARTVEDLAGIDQALQAPDLAQAAMSAGTASLRLDEFTIPSCGFKFSN